MDEKKKKAWELYKEQLVHQYNVEKGESFQNVAEWAITAVEIFENYYQKRIPTDYS